MGGVIKSGKLQSERGSTQSIKFNLEDMTERANDYLEHVRKQAAALLAEARSQAAQVAEEARQAGQQTALVEAEQQLQGKLTDQIATLFPALENVIRDLEHSKQAWLRHWEQETIHLAVAIAARVVRRELAQDPDISLAWIREALTLAVGTGAIKIHLHPHDQRAMGERIQHLIDGMSELGEVTLIADPEISPGGCRVSTQFGEVDQQLETQLARIEDELNG